MKYLIAALTLMTSINPAAALNQLKNYNAEPFTEVRIFEWGNRNQSSKMTIDDRNRLWSSYIEGAKASPLVDGGLEKNYAHFCEKASGTCSDVIFYKSKSGPMMLAEITDLNDKLLVRLACYFPRTQMDVRVCGDFDRGGEEKSIRKSDGTWEMAMGETTK